MSRPVRWGVLGAARIAEKVGPAIQQSVDGELHALACRSAERGQDWANRHDVPNLFGSYQELLDAPEIDAVYIPLPPALHHEWTIKAAEAGKHVLCEKPLAIDHSQTLEMAAACKQHNVQLMDGVMWYHHPRARMMLEVIRSGELGELRRIVSAFTFCWPEVPKNEFRLQRGMGGGSLYDLGWYNVGAALWLLNRRPEAVQASAQYRDDVDMSFAGWMFYGDGLLCSFDCGFETVLRRWIEFAGREQSLVCDDFTRPWTADKARFWIHDKTGTSTEHRSETPVQEVCMIDDFNQIVQTGELVPEWTHLATETQLICDLLDQSARAGKRIEVPHP